MINLKKILNVIKEWDTASMDITQQSARIVVNPITVYSYGFLFNCMIVGQASDSMAALTQSFNPLVGD